MLWSKWQGGSFMNNKKFIFKENGIILGDWNEGFRYAVLFTSIPVNKEIPDSFDILAFNETPEDIKGFDRTLYAAKIHEFSGTDIGFSDLPLPIQKAVIVKRQVIFLEDIVYQHVYTGKLRSAYETGKTHWIETWQQQKNDGAIPPDSPDYDAPIMLPINELIELGIEYLESIIDYDDTPLYVIKE